MSQNKLHLSPSVIVLVSWISGCCVALIGLTAPSNPPSYYLHVLSPENEVVPLIHSGGYRGRVLSPDSEPVSSRITLNTALVAP